MEVKVILKEVKRHTIVCDTCRKRKRRCDGASPCSFCSLHHLPCAYTHITKKRGPRKKTGDSKPYQIDGSSSSSSSLVQSSFGTSSFSHPFQPPNYSNLNASPAEMLWENDINTYFEQSLCASLYRQYCKYGCPDMQDLLVPTPSRRMLLAIVMAWTCRVCGDYKRSNEFINDARAISGQVFDELSLDGYQAFAAMSLYHTGSKSSHYANIAYSLIKQLPPTTKHIKRLQSDAYKTSIIMDATIVPSSKYRALIQHAHDFTSGLVVDCECEKCRRIPTAVHAVLLRMIATIVLKINIFYDVKAQLHMLECHFTKQECDALRLYCDQMEAILTTNMELFAGAHHSWLMITRLMRAVVWYKEGQMEQAISETLKTVDSCQHESIIYSMVNNIGFLALLATLACRLSLIQAAHVVGRRIATMCSPSELDELMPRIPLDWKMLKENILPRPSLLNTKMSAKSPNTHDSSPATVSSFIATGDDEELPAQQPEEAQRYEVLPNLFTTASESFEATMSNLTAIFATRPAQVVPPVTSPVSPSSSTSSTSSTPELISPLPVQTPSPTDPINPDSSSFPYFSYQLPPASDFSSLLSQIPASPNSLLFTDEAFAQVLENTVLPSSSSPYSDGGSSILS